MVNSINYSNQHLKGMEKMKIKKNKISDPFPNFFFPPPNDAESHDDQNQQRDNDGHNNACVYPIAAGESQYTVLGPLIFAMSMNIYK